MTNQCTGISSCQDNKTDNAIVKKGKDQKAKNSKQ